MNRGRAPPVTSMFDSYPPLMRSFVRQALSPGLEPRPSLVNLLRGGYALGRSDGYHVAIRAKTFRGALGQLGFFLGIRSRPEYTVAYLAGRFMGTVACALVLRKAQART